MEPGAPHPTRPRGQPVNPRGVGQDEQYMTISKGVNVDQSGAAAGHETWFAKKDDLIGGWCVMTVDLTPGELSEQPEVVRAQHRCIADFTREEHAREIARLHNGQLHNHPDWTLKSEWRALGDGMLTLMLEPNATYVEWHGSNGDVILLKRDNGESTLPKRLGLLQATETHWGTRNKVDPSAEPIDWRDDKEGARRQAEIADRDIVSREVTEWEVVSE